MSLTMKEKEHWNDRIAGRIDQAIEELETSTDAGFLGRADAEAREMAYASLGLKALNDEDGQLSREMKRLEARQRQVRQAMCEHITGTEERTTWHCTPYAVTAAVDRRMEVHRREILAKTERGREILRLRQAREELLDKLWLATSPIQIRELWTRLSALLDRDMPDDRNRIPSVDVKTDET